VADDGTPAEDIMIGNTNDAWGWPARSLHWVTALLIIAVFAFGLWMADVPARAERPYYFAIHASLGVTLLVLVAARFAWATLNVAPTAPAGTPAWQVGVARFTHAGLYGLTFATALLGWLLAGAAEPPIEPQAFGLVPIPAPVFAGRASEDFLEEAHEVTAYALVGLAGVHAAAALYHHFVLGDSVLRRMIFGADRRET
jgi:cytochrome b561